MPALRVVPCHHLLLSHGVLSPQHPWGESHGSSADWTHSPLLLLPRLGWGPSRSRAGDPPPPPASLPRSQPPCPWGDAEQRTVAPTQGSGAIPSQGPRVFRVAILTLETL